MSDVNTSIIRVAAQIDPAIRLAAAVISSIRAFRDATKAANPTLPDGTFPSDTELIHRLLTEAGLLKIEAAELTAWLETLIPSPSDPTP